MLRHKRLKTSSLSPAITITGIVVPYKVTPTIVAKSNHHFILPIGLWVRVFGKDLAGAALAWSLSCGYSETADGATVICRVSQIGSQNGPLAWLAADAADWLGAQPGS